MCIDSTHHIDSNCQSGGDYCSGQYVCLPDWKHSKTGGFVETGSAPDADEDATLGIIMAVRAVENDAIRPSWYEDARIWADASSTALFQFNTIEKDGFQLVKLGSCWGGWESSGNNPSYHSPAAYSAMRDFQVTNGLANDQRNGYNAIPRADWNSLVQTSYSVLRAVQCNNGGAMVPNWATMTVSNGVVELSGGSFSNGNTGQYEYGAEASRTTWRVALDAALYPENSADWSAYLSEFNWRLNDNFNGSGWPYDTFPNCRGPNTAQEITVFPTWNTDAFIYGPTFSALIAATTDIPNAEAMIAAAGQKMAEALPDGYYSRSWAMLSNLLLNGAMESAGQTMKG